MKTIGTCKECKWWNDWQCSHIALDAYHPGNENEVDVFAYDDSYPLRMSPDFGCIHWESKDDTHSANYPTRTAQDLEIADLKRENNAAFDRIKELSEELVRLGVDPTAKAD